MKPAAGPIDLRDDPDDKDDSGAKAISAVATTSILLSSFAYLEQQHFSNMQVGTDRPGFTKLPALSTALR